MDLPSAVMSFAVLASGAAAIVASYQPSRRLRFVVLKPFTTFFVLIIVLFPLLGSRTLYPGLIAAGLVFSIAGDIFLTLPQEYFARGILSFAATHALYLFAFAAAAGIALVHPPTLVFLAVALALVALIWRGVEPSLRIPVLAYTMLITAMVTQAAGASIVMRTTRTTLAAAGALLFFVSDAVLAIDRFRLPLAPARAVVLSTYWLGQLLIALSTGF